jgi:ribokinase
MKSDIVVVGSLNMDFVVSVERLPAPGETILGSGFCLVPGGKGANQACAAGKLAGSSLRTRMVGRVGYDVFADHLRASLSAAGVDVSAVHGSQTQPTGVALIWVERSGQNSIVVAPGANQELKAADVEALRPIFHSARLALFQLETPLDAVAAALKLAREEGATTILDPAPAQPLPEEVLAAVDILTPNESEACLLLGRSAARVDRTDARLLAEGLLERGPRAVLLKLGDQGCLYWDGSREVFSPAFKMQVVDSTAAGDTFNAAFAVALAEGRPVESALQFANAAAGLSVTRMGAQASIPAREEVDTLLHGIAKN